MILSRFHLIIFNTLISKIMCTRPLQDNFDQGNYSNDYLADCYQSIHTQHRNTHTQNPKRMVLGPGVWSPISDFSKALLSDFGKDLCSL